MDSFLDHAITVRDVLYVWLACMALVAVAVIAAALVLQRRDRKQAASDLVYAADMRRRPENLRNPAYGVPDIKPAKTGQADNSRNPAYGLKDRQ